MAVHFAVRAGVADSTIYAYDGLTTTLLGTIAAGSTNPRGVDFLTSGGVTSIIDGTTGTMFRHAPGWSSTIVESVTPAGSVVFNDLGHDASNNVIVPSPFGPVVTKFSGFSSTVLASFNPAETTRAANPDSNGDTVGNRVTSLDWVRFTLFTSTANATFMGVFVTAINGGDVDDSDNTLATWDSALFGGLQLWTLYSGFSSTVLLQVNRPLSNFFGNAWFDGTFDFSILFNGAALFVFGASGELLVIPAEECHWLEGVTNDWMDAAAPDWFDAGGAGWLTAASGEWAEDADGDWFDPKECS